MGDFNMTPDDALLEPIRAVMNDTETYMIGNRMTFPSDAPDCKIDYIFTSRDASVKTACVPAIVASDHRPIVSKIEF
jgi:endonuclease/exonuclease/phosphatase family metal-dependent hydrolase